MGLLGGRRAKGDGMVPIVRFQGPFTVSHSPIKTRHPSGKNRTWLKIFHGFHKIHVLILEEGEPNVHSTSIFSKLTITSFDFNSFFYRCSFSHLEVLVGGMAGSEPYKYLPAIFQWRYRLQFIFWLCFYIFWNNVFTAMSWAGSSHWAAAIATYKLHF